MLSYNEIKTKKYIVHEGAPWEVLDHHVSRKQANKPVNKTKLKNLLSGNVVDYTFHVSDKVREADIGKKTIKFLYTKSGRNGSPDEFWFSEVSDPSKRFTLDASIAEYATRFIKGNDVIDTLIFTDYDKEKIIGLQLPIKVDLKVVEAPPNIKGNTASGGDKQVTLETGLVVSVPLFIEAGEIIRVNTDTSQYIERVR